MLIDITRPIAPDSLVYPGDPAPKFTRLADINGNSDYELTQVSFSVHTGTHIDAPRHFIPDGIRVADIDLERLVCTAHVIEADDPKHVSSHILAGLPIESGQAVLFKTENSKLPQVEMAQQWVYLDTGLAAALVFRKVALVGFDYIEIEHPLDQNKYPVHKKLLGAGIPILENIDLSGVEPGKYTLLCLPLKLENAEAAPCRAILTDCG